MTTDDREAIEALIFGYASSVDRGDLGRFGSLFAGATLAIAGSPVEANGADQVRAMVRKGLHWYDGTPGTRHVTTNVVVSIDDDPDRATAESSVVVYQALADFPLQVVLVAHYDDQFVREEHRWRFSHRLLTYDLLGDLSRHFTKPVPRAGR